MAQNYLAEKSAMAYVLRQHGIQTILTRPEDLSMNTVNKYLELKSRNMI
jgi:N-acetylmuramoyl-L-alanine amidase